MRVDFFGCPLSALEIREKRKMLDIKAVQNRILDLTESLREYVELSRKSRTKLSRAARKRLSAIEAELESILEPQERSSFVYDGENIGKFFGVSARTVRRWAQTKGCPKLQHGLYDLKAVHEWWLENIRGDGEQQSPEIEDAKLEYWKWKAKREKISVQRLRGELFERREVAQQWALRVGEVTAGLSMLKDRLPPLVEGKPRSEVAAVVEEEVRLIREAYARRGKYCGA